MPIYSYQCSKCENVFEKFLSISNRKEPEHESCPNCNEIECIKQVVLEAPKLVSDYKTPLRRAGSGWTDVLNGIKKASGRDNTIKT